MTEIRATQDKERNRSGTAGTSSSGSIHDAWPLVEEISGVADACGISRFFGTDDNFFSHRGTAEGALMAMARGKVGNKPFRKAINFAAEATEFDVFKIQDLLPLARDAGMRGLWLGIEDLTAGLVKKGQTVERTKTLFKLLLKQGIATMPMMMHHDGQPLWTCGTDCTACLTR